MINENHKIKNNENVCNYPMYVCQGLSFGQPTMLRKCSLAALNALQYYRPQILSLFFPHQDRQ